MSTDKAPTPVIFGCQGLQLSDRERDFFHAVRPAGFILFSRNCESRSQVADLVTDLRGCAGAEQTLILIDQEGGRVQRLSPPEWRAAPSAAALGSIATGDPDAAAEAVNLNTLLIADDLRALGINADCAPVVDVPASGSHDIIGDRAFSDDPVVLANLARVMAESLLAGGVLPVIKHLPGHGRARADSHLELPVVDAPKNELEAVDFAAFVPLADMPLGMTAHIIYVAIDDKPATLSPVVIQDVIRGQIDFDGLLMTDDLSMHALRGSFTARAKDSLAAGCDIVLHCNGDMEEMAEIAEATIGQMTGVAAKRLARAQSQISGSPTPAPDGALARLGQLMAGASVAND